MARKDTPPSSARDAASPWPRVRTAGELEPASREWLHTNGAGAYSMSTLALMHTRREHGLLVAALEPPVRRGVVLSQAEVTIHQGERKHRLATHRFPATAPTPGYRYLEQFAQDPIPRWTYRVGKATFERTLCLARGVNVLVLGFCWNGGRPVHLEVRPLLPVRPIDSLIREHGAMMQTVGLRSGAVEIRPVQSLPRIVFGHQGVFLGSPDWWRRFEYAEDENLGRDFQEDLWTPGKFELTLEPGVTSRIVVAVDDLPDATAEEMEEEAADNARWFDPGPTRPLAVRMLSVASAAYCADECDRPSIVAGYPHYGVYMRDLLVALPGLYLARGQVEGARKVLDWVASLVDPAGLPRRLFEHGGTDDRGGDADLWLFEAARCFVETVGANDRFVRPRLFSALRLIFERMLRGDRGPIWIAEDGLVTSSSPSQPLTWMDSRPGREPAARRDGKPIELQALWANACELMARLAERQGETRLAELAQEARGRVLARFSERFWCIETAYPFDVLSQETLTGDAWADPSIRPNAVIALALCPDLFDHSQATRILKRARRDLLTPRGLRTLSPYDSQYVGAVTGDRREREAAMHQGTAWPFLLGSFVRASLALDPDDPKVVATLVRIVERVLAEDRGSALGQVGQVFDGSDPQRPRGCPAQAWSVAELLRVLSLDLGL